jgi:hypothetical protein
MKRFKCVLLLFSFMGLMLVGCSDQSESPVSPSDQASIQKVATREFSGTNNPTGITINPEIRKYPDGKILFYKYVGETEFAVNFPDGGLDIMSGAGVVEINGITDLSTMIGQWHGKFTLTPNANAGGGIWESTWIGTSTFALDAYNGTPGWLLPLTEQGHGEGGSINGMQCRYMVTVHANPEFTSYYTEVEGVVISH